MLAIALLSLTFGIGPVAADQNNKGATRQRPAATMIAQSNCASAGTVAKNKPCHTYCKPSECANGTCNPNNSTSSNGTCN